MLSDLLAGVGKDAAAVLKQADTDDIRKSFASETEVARSAETFGAPAFVVG
ncbi:MAG: hypothetical protein JWR21_15 [Herminiimonas sp.]|nr:hypothetical protein [Herminiimonas sp.]